MPRLIISFTLIQQTRKDIEMQKLASGKLIEYLGQLLVWSLKSRKVWNDFLWSGGVPGLHPPGRVQRRPAHAIPGHELARLHRARGHLEWQAPLVHLQQQLQRFHSCLARKSRETSGQTGATPTGTRATQKAPRQATTWIWKEVRRPFQNSSTDFFVKFLQALANSTSLEPEEWLNWCFFPK